MSTMIRFSDQAVGTDHRLDYPDSQPQPTVVETVPTAGPRPPGGLAGRTEDSGWCRGPQTETRGRGPSLPLQHQHEPEGDGQL